VMQKRSGILHCAKAQRSWKTVS